MAQAEVQARLNICLRDIVTFFEEAGVREDSILLLNSFIDKHLTVDFLNLAEGFGNCMAFIDHNELIRRILESFNTLLSGYVLERKLYNKRIRILREDKKADPELIAKLEHLLTEVDQKKAQAMVTAARLRAMNAIPVDKFRDPKFNALDYYDKNVEKIQIVRKK